jgi:hypothetical protein
MWIVFNKVNGDRRIMRVINKPTDFKSSDKEYTPNENQCNVYDLDDNKWKSFRWTNLVNYQTNEIETKTVN